MHSGEDQFGEPQKQLPDVYANQVSFMISPFEVTMTFGLLMQPGEPAKDLVRVRMSPQHALILSRVLEKNMAAYEAQVGKINLPPKMFEAMGLEGE